MVLESRAIGFFTIGHMHVTVFRFFFFIFSDRNLGYLFIKHLTTNIKNVFLLYTQLNATMPQIETIFLLHAGILNFNHFEICDGIIINALQCFKNSILVIRFFVNRYMYPGTFHDKLHVHTELAFRCRDHCGYGVTCLWVFYRRMYACHRFSGFFFFYAVSYYNCMPNF
jgi:hypothetical protein